MTSVTDDRIRPRYGESALADVMPGALAVLGVPGSPDPLGLAEGRLAGARTVVVLLIDGLGHHQLPLAARFTPTLADFSAGRIEGASPGSITTGFPSTTPTSLASLTTGSAPGAHGIVGFFLNIPGTNRVLNHIEWYDDPEPARWQPLPTQFELARAAGVATYSVVRPEYEGSGLTSAIFRGAEFRGAATLNELATEVLGLATAATGPTLIYAYHPDVDKQGHIYGVNSPQWRDAMVGVDRLVARLLEGLPPGAALVITADHGQVNIPRDRRFDIHTDARLAAGVRIVAGEARVRYLHTVDGARDDVLATWRGVLGDAAWVLTREQAVAEGWFGAVPDAHLARIGDVVAGCREDYVVLASGTEPRGTVRNIAYHGSATEPEMRIPLLIATRPGGP